MNAESNQSAADAPGPWRPQVRPVTFEGALTGTSCEPISGANKTPVLFLHGMMAGAWQFESLQPYFAELGHASVALNYRGHHGSRHVSNIGKVSVLDYAEDARIAAARLGRPIVVGQSMGGLVALKVAEAGLASAVVLLCALPPAGIRWRGARRLRGGLAHLPSVLRGAPLSPDRGELDALIFNAMEPSRRTRYFERQIPESSRAALEITLGRIAVDTKRIDVPLLSVTTSRDQLVFPDVGARIARAYGGDVIEFQGCGHYALVGETGWEERSRVIYGWLEARGVT